MIRISRYSIMCGVVEFVTTEFDIFAHKPVQTAILETHAVHYKSIATVDENDLECFIPGDNETYIYLDINPLKSELNSICYLLALLGARHFLHVSRIRVKLLTFRLLMSYIWSTHS